MWNYSLIKRKTVFTVGIRVGSTTYFTHGVNGSGEFGNLPYMNGTPERRRRGGANVYRIDLLTDRLLRGRLSFDEARELVKTRELVNIPGASMHSLLGDSRGNMLLAEPGLGYRELGGRYACVTNFPVLEPPERYASPFYGRDRYDRVCEVLEAADEDFAAADGMRLLSEVSQGGTWATRISFVYSCGENAAYYCTDGRFDDVGRWQLRRE